MTDPMTVWEALTTPLTWKPELDQAITSQAYELVQRHQRVLNQAEKELSEKINGHVRARDPAGVLVTAQQLSEIVQKEQALDKAQTEDGPLPVATNVFVFSSMMLRDSYRYCTKTKEEGMHFILGIEVDGVGIGTRLVGFPCREKSIASASGDHLATHRICIDTHEYGHRVLGLLHSHPGKGKRANYPSSVDERTQELWERGFRMCFGIWSRDGFLRFFGSKLDCTIKVVGNYVENIEDDLFKLSK